MALISACAHQPTRHIYVPKTPEAAKCWRECKAIAATCLTAAPAARNLGTAIVHDQYEERCEEERKDCLLTCPGATEEWR